MRPRFMIIGAFAIGSLIGHVKPSAAEVDRTLFRGESASASLLQRTEITCQDGSTGFAETSIFLNAFTEIINSTFGDFSGETVFVFFSELNSCTGEARSAFALDPEANYNQARVSSASVAGTFELVDGFTGEAIGTLVLNVDFTGIGTTFRSNTHSTVQSGSFIFQSRSQGVFRDASVNGSITLDGEDLLVVTQFAQLSDTRSGDLSVTQ